MFANIGFAEIRLIEEKEVGRYSFQTTCVDGYKFVTVYNYNASGQTHRSLAAMGLSITQFYEVGSQSPIPTKC